jgi:ankyrin repeat protein
MNAVDDLGDTVLHSAIRAGLVPIIKKLLTEGGSDVDAVNLHKQTPLHTLAKYPNDSAMRIFQELLPFLRGSVNPQVEG